MAARIARRTSMLCLRKNDTWLYQFDLHKLVLLLPPVPRPFLVVMSRPDQSLGSLEVSLTILSTQLAEGSSHIDAAMTHVSASHISVHLSVRVSPCSLLMRHLGLQITWFE